MVMKTLSTTRIEGGQAKLIHAETQDPSEVLAHAGKGWTIPEKWVNTIEGRVVESSNPKINKKNQLVWLLIKMDEV